MVLWARNGHAFAAILGKFALAKDKIVRSICSFQRQSRDGSRALKAVESRAPPRYTKRMWKIRAECEGDLAGVARLVDQGFGPGRFAKTAYRLREGVFPDTRLSFVAQDCETEALLGSVRFWPVRIGEALSLLLGPLAVEPRLRGQGIGIALMQQGIEEAKTLGYEAVILVGDEPYYAKVGFARLPPGRVRFPGPVDPGRVLGLALKANALVTLAGDVSRARLDQPVSAQAVRFG
jgi:predicted N-acetyltransferase YhbS